MRAGEFLAAEPGGEGEWTFSLPRQVHGAFGGAFGGLVAACAVLAARPLAAGRRPSALDCRFVRGLGAGRAHAAARVVHSGRSLIGIAVELAGEDGRLAAVATVSFVDPSVLEPLDVEPSPWTVADRLPGQPWKSPPGVEAPIIETLRPETAGIDERGIATAVSLPWDDPAADAEAICLAADMCVGPPVAAALGGRWLPHPNPDLSLRFAGAPEKGPLVGAGRLERVAGGLAMVAISVSSADRLVAVGVSTSLVLPAPR